MAKVTSIVKQEPIITLELSDTEAEFIKNLVQNDLTGNESTDQHQIRTSIWNALHKAGI